MNRTTALLLAMAALLAHALAVHVDPSGRLGQPFEEAHAAFRLARNLVREGALAWNITPAGTEGGLGAHASPLLVLVAALAERLYLPVNRFAQLAGVLAGLLTVSASARFATDRSAGVIPALLLVCSGVFAAATASGTEFALAALALTAAYVARERGRAPSLAVALTLLVLVRVEGLVLAGLLGLLTLLQRQGPANPRGPLPLSSLLPAAITGAVLLYLPDGNGGHLYAHRLGTLFTTGHLEAGGRYLADFLFTAVTPFLLIFPLGALLLGRLGGEAWRALLLAGAWIALVTLEGGGGRGTYPFTIALMPALPLLAIAIQFGVIAALDSRRRGLEPLSWAALLLVALLSALPSKALSTLARHEAWIGASISDPGLGRHHLRGRAALQEEQQRTAELRDLGRFLRENVDPSLSLLSPWSGALGYLADRPVLDLSGCRTGYGLDLITSLERAPDLILPWHRDGESLVLPRGGLAPIDPIWQWHPGEASPEERRRVQAILDAYELVTLPVPSERDPRRIGGETMRLLRRRSLECEPRLVLERDSDGSAVVVRALPPLGSSSGPQLVHLEIIARDSLGEHWSVDPRGHLHSGSGPLARSSIVVGLEGDRETQLFRFTRVEAPNGAPLVELQATLLNPRLRRRNPLSEACSSVLFELE